MKQINHFIDNSFVTSTPDYIESLNPALGTINAEIQQGNAEIVDCVVKSAHLAFQNWSKTSRGERSALLMRIAGIIEERINEFALGMGVASAS